MKSVKLKVIKIGLKISSQDRFKYIHSIQKKEVSYLIVPAIG